MSQKHLFAICLLASVGGLFVAAQVHANSSHATDVSYRPYQALVKFKDSRSIPNIAHARMQELYAGVFLVDFDRQMVNSRDTAELRTAALIQGLGAHPDVEYAHPNFRMLFTQAVPDDPLYPLQWNLTAVRASQAWNRTVGSPDVVIAILDSGYSSHPDLASKWVYWANADNPGLPLASDSWAHSAHVAGIAAAATDNQNGIAGVCPQCSMQSIKVSDSSGTPYMSTVISGMATAIANGANVINLSLSVYSYGVACTQAPAMQAAINAALDSQVSVVVAAGNHGNQVSLETPASCEGVIAVAATGPGNHLALYSNHGAGITLAAPGGGGHGGGIYGAAINCPSDPNSWFSDKTWGIVSAWTTSIPYGQDHCYRYLSGTSMAAPHVSGAIGLMLSVDPDLSPQELKQVLQETARDLPGCGFKCGAGLLDLDAAIYAVEGGGLDFLSILMKLIID